MTTSFGATATADQVLEGVDLRGRRILVTGVSAGMGVETARALVTHGAEVIGAARNLGKAQSAAEQVRDEARGKGSFELMQLDLASLDSVRTCADALIAVAQPLDAIIANAGVMGVPKGTTADGFETQLGTNHLGHFVLVNRVVGLLGPGSRVVMVSSAGHRGADVDLDDPYFEHTPYDPLAAYRRSKTANILFAVGFDHRHRARDVRAAAVHPGAVLTDTTRKMIEAQPSAASAFDWKSPAQGAATALWTAFVAKADTVGARYCEDCHVAEINDDPIVRSGVRSYALNRERAEALWVESESLVGERF